MVGEHSTPVKGHGVDLTRFTRYPSDGKTGGKGRKKIERSSQLYFFQGNIWGRLANP